MKQLDIHQLLATAIQGEQEAYEFYHTVAERATNAMVKGIFKQLAEEEQEHREVFEQFQKDPALLMKIKLLPTDDNILGDTELPTLNLNMKPAEAIVLAIKKEKQAVQFYQTLGERASDPEVKQVFERFMQIERAHQHRLEQMQTDFILLNL